MKFATLAGLVASAAADEAFLINEEIINFDAASDAQAKWSAATKKAWDEAHAITVRVGEGFCQPIVDYNVWDLKPLDSMKAVETFTDSVYHSHYFAIKLCEPEFESDTLPTFKDSNGDSYEQPSGAKAITNAGNAYWVSYDKNSDGDRVINPMFSFDSANFVPNKNSEGDIDNSGWTLTYTSNQGCDKGEVDPSGTTPFVYTIHGVCDKAATKLATKNFFYNAEKCEAEVTFTTSTGCIAYDGGAFFKALEPYMGTIAIIFGGLMTFAGAYFLMYLIGGTVGIFITVFFYAVISNLFFTVKTGTGAKVGVLIVGLALAVAGAYAFFKLVSHWGSSIIAALAGAMGVKFLFTIIGVLNGWV